MSYLTVLFIKSKTGMAVAGAAERGKRGAFVSRHQVSGK